MVFRSPLPSVEIPLISFTDFILEHCDQYGDKPALIDGPSGRTITFKQLKEYVRRAALEMSRLGFKREDVLGIYAPNCPEYAVMFHAAASLGGLNTTVNPTYTAEELGNQLRDSRATFLFTLCPFLENAKRAAVDCGLKKVIVLGLPTGTTDSLVMSYTDLLVDRPAMQLPSVRINPKEDMVVLPYSSGTTGVSKGVQLTHYNLVANIVQTLPEVFLPRRDDDVAIGVLPFFHIYGMVVVMGASLRVGTTIVCMPKFEPVPFLTILQKYGVTIACLVPPIILFLAKHPAVSKFPLPRLRHIMSGAASLAPELAVSAAARLGCAVRNGYGMTELSPVSHILPFEDNEHPGSIGVLIPNTEGRLVDPDTGSDVGYNTPGELWIRGPQVMKGYLNNVTATAQTLDNEGWLHTGDVATVNAKGVFYIVDRVKELIKYKGFQVAPAELEALLLKNPNIADAAVIGVADEKAGEVPRAFVVRGNHALTQHQVQAYVEEHVAPHKRLRGGVVFVQAIPKSLSGKILRRQLRDIKPAHL